MPGRQTNFLKIIGPGLLYAGAAIGVSHLVQSTRAGAEYGFSLIIFILLANFLKYPFFEFGPRYAIATGETLIEGYRRLGKWALIIFLVLTFGTMFTIQAAVTVVTAGLAANLFPGAGLDPVQWSIVLLILCLLILLIGKFVFLDTLMKVIIILLTITTITAVAASLQLEYKGDYLPGISLFNEKSSVLFLIALMGWMPAPIDISIWHSIWSLEKIKSSGYKPTLKESLQDFHLGYWGTTFLALCFLTLGAMVMYNSPESLSPSGVVFANQFVDLYTSTLGKWTHLIIAIAALTTMFSTTITCLDAFPRVLKRTSLLFLKDQSSGTGKKSDPLYWFWIIIVASGAVILLSILRGTMTFMVDLATTLSFLTAPILAIINYRLVTSRFMPEAFHPGKTLRVISWLGIIFLAGFSIFFLFVYL